MFNFLEVSKELNIVSHNLSPKDIIEGISWDTRAIKKNSFFVALVGDVHDAHSFIDDKLVDKLDGIIVSSKPVFDKYKEKTKVILVKNTLGALQSLAAVWRHKVNPKVVGITGSNGKTSTKEFLAAILGDMQGVHYSKGSFNNHWGVPFSILEAPKLTKIIILEMGMNHAGEIKRLCQIASPTHVVVTNVGRSHTGFFKNMDEIAKAKQEIYEASAVKVFNADNAWTKKMIEDNEHNFIFSSVNESADIFLQLTGQSEEGLEISGKIGGVKGKTVVRLFGEHHIENIMSAAGLALSLGIDPKTIWKNISLCKSTWGRTEWRKSPNGYSILFDAYNSNPESVKALFNSAKKINKNKWLVIGEMKELGDDSADAHKEIGELAQSVGFLGIWYVGDFYNEFKMGLGKYEKYLVKSDTYNESLAIEFRNMLHTNDVVFIKGSRALKLEKVSKVLESSK